MLKRPAIFSLAMLLAATLWADTLTYTASTLSSVRVSYVWNQCVDTAGTSPSNVMTPDDDDSSYRGSGVGTKGDYYNMGQSIPAGATSITARVTARIKSGAAGKTASVCWNKSGVYAGDAEDGQFGVTTSWTNYQSSVISLASVAEANSMLCGFYSNDTGVFFTSISVVFTYTPAASGVAPKAMHYARMRKR